MASPVVIDAMRQTALTMLTPRPHRSEKVFCSWGNGDKAAWAIIRPEDTVPVGFTGLRLIFRTTRREQNAETSALVSGEMIHDDASGQIVGVILDQLRLDCNRIASAP